MKIWKKHIEYYGYKLPDTSSVNTLHSDTLRRTIYLLKRYIRYKKWLRDNDYISNFFKCNKRICIFGAGKLGRESVYFFEHIPGAHRITKIFDNKAVGNISGIDIVRPEKKLLLATDEAIVVASVKYEQEIIAGLREYGIKSEGQIYSISQMIYDTYGLKQRFMGESYVNQASIK